MGRTVACATAIAAALAAVGVTSTSSQAVGSDRKAARYAAIVHEDPTASLDSDGNLYYTEPVPSAAAVRARQAVPALAPQFPLSQTFQLHSQPGSDRTILLDFDGATVSGTAWNSEGLPNGSHPAWTLDGNASTFNNNERTLIQEIWQRVAEDFAPFDVDVTTEDPGTAGIVRSGAGDQVFGARALITPSNAVDQLCDGDCVGIAYLDVFDQVGGDSQPVWVFPQYYEDNAKGIAETVSHEVGHNLDLEHDGNSQEGYDSGHAPWAPIMGNSDFEPISQWSKGDYDDADNQQDDFAVIAGAGLNLRTDDAGNSVGAASALPDGTAYIASRTDKDFWALGQCSGSVKVTATGAAVGTNLDIELRLYDAGGTQVAVNNPLSAKVDADVASGMNAAITTSVGAGQYVAAVDGVGNGSPKTGYDDYASVGAYTLTVTGCEGGPVDPGGETPSAPQSLSASPDPSGTSALISWDEPADEGGSAITGYEVTVGGVTDSVSAATFSYEATGLSRGETYDVSVVAVNDAGAGAAATTSFSTGDVPGPPVITGAGSGALGGKVTASVRWAPPADDGGSAITGYVIKATRWSVLGSALWSGSTDVLPASQLSSSLQLPKAGIWSFRVRAFNDIGTGPLSKASKRVRGR
ncbi:fibronectin type III domain-containing protein [Nocardioides sp. SR21]|uniref:fibronectin type III domain-containing protein n=1 Tax=Nocardioides sp. SR21 TaxID=2919501 RepID=UPI001FAB2CEC|nr:fibronectin type III domain-containing protein [Nocardioides sp. SR21]